MILPAKCPVCRDPLPVKQKGKAGPKHVYCSRRCGLIDFHMRKFRDLLDEVVEDQAASPAQLYALRSYLWRAGNQIKPLKGRTKFGTTFWRLVLTCGHSKNEQYRWRRVGGVRVPDPAPKRTRCYHCEGHPLTVVSTHVACISMGGRDAAPGMLQVEGAAPSVG